MIKYLVVLGLLFHFSCSVQAPISFDAYVDCENSEILAPDQTLLSDSAGAVMVHIAVYDNMMKEVAVYSGGFESGLYEGSPELLSGINNIDGEPISVLWNGTDNDGNPISSGKYIFKYSYN